jgi:hypothetical protein
MLRWHEVLLQSATCLCQKVWYTVAVALTRAGLPSSAVACGGVWLWYTTSTQCRRPLTSTRSLARLNLLVVISLLFSLIPTPQAAQAGPSPRPVVERRAVEHPAATAARALVWSPPVRPVGLALGAASATVQPGRLAMPVAGELAETAAKTLAQPAAAPAAVTHPDPWPPAD